MALFVVENNTDLYSTYQTNGADYKSEFRDIRVRTESGKPGKQAVFWITQGIPGKLREVWEKAQDSGKTQGK